MSLRDRFFSACGTLRERAGRAKLRFYESGLGIDTDETCAKHEISRYRDMVRYEPSHYGRLKRIIARMGLLPDDVFIDLGCGKGRVVCLAAQRRLRRIIGVEIDPALAALARGNVAMMRRRQTNVSVVVADAVDYSFTDETAVFIFNPFGYRTLEAVIDSLERSITALPRRVRIAYLNPLHRGLLDSRGWLRPPKEVPGVNCLIWETTSHAQARPSAR